MLSCRFLFLGEVSEFLTIAVVLIAENHKWFGKTNYIAKRVRQSSNKVRFSRSATPCALSGIRCGCIAWSYTIFSRNLWRVLGISELRSICITKTLVKPLLKASIVVKTSRIESSRGRVMINPTEFCCLISKWDEIGWCTFGRLWTDQICQYVGIGKGSYGIF